MKLPRFSLRALLLLTALLAGVCYWRDRPRQIANRFVAAIDAGDYKLAESMFDQRLTDTKYLGLHSGKWVVKKRGQSLNDWLRGRNPMTLVKTFSGSHSYTLAVEAHASGIERLFHQFVVNDADSSTELIGGK